MLSSSTSLTDVITVSDYRMISEQVENRIVDNDGLVKLKQDMGFDQLRFYCRKKSVGRTFHIMTNNDTLGRNAVRSKVESFLPQAQACGSFTALADDTSVLSQNCDKWGYDSGYRKNKWGSNHPGFHYMLGVHLYVMVGVVTSSDLTPRGCITTVTTDHLQCRREIRLRSTFDTILWCLKRWRESRTLTDGSNSQGALPIRRVKRWREGIGEVMTLRDPVASFI